MKNTLNRVIAIILAVSMFMSTGVLEAVAINASANETVTMKATDVTVTQSDAAQTVWVTLYMDKDAEIKDLSVYVDIVDAQSIGATFADGTELGNTSFSDQDINIPAGGILGAIVAVDKVNAYQMPLDDALEGYWIAKVPVSIPAGVTGEVEVLFSEFALGDISGKAFTTAPESVTATITVEEPKAPPKTFEIFYELDSATDEKDIDGDEGTDKYVEYDVPQEITATVKLRNNGEATFLQAYDLYLTYAGNLQYVGHNMTGAQAYEKNSETPIAADNTSALVYHIQAVSEGFTAVEMAKGAEITLGTITFKISDAAEYDEELHITLTEGTNSDIVTNISVGENKAADNAAQGDHESHYPDVIGDVLGAEISTTYTVEYDANAGDDTVTDMPEDQTKLHNIDLDLSDTVPTRAGYTFMGWNTKADGNGDPYCTGENDKVYAENADVTLYAQWEQDTVTITFVDEDGTELQISEVAIGDMPVYNGEEPTKAADAQYTYTFAGWTPAIVVATVPATYTATYTEIVNEYTITFVDEDGTELQSDKVAYGETPVYKGDEPTKAADKENTYKFAGWDPKIETVTQDATYTATYTATPIEYTVTFVDNGDGNSMNAGYEEFIKLPSAAEKTGYTFAYWQNEANENVGAAGADYQVLDNVTLTAVYTVNQYTVEFDGNGAESGSVTSITKNYDETFTMPANGFVKTGWKFDGWNTMSDGSGTSYAAGQSYNKLATSGTVKLYAQWSQAKYKVDTETVTNGTLTAPENANFEQSVTITVTPEAGYEIEGDKITYTYKDGDNVVTEEITVTDEDGDGTYTGTLTMPDADIVVSTVFVLKDLNVTVDKDSIENGTVVADKEIAKIGETVTLTPTPDEGYELDEFIVTDADGNEVPVSEDGTFEMPATDVTVTATFVAIEYNVNIGTINNGTVTVAPNKAIIGTTIQLNPDPATGYKLVSYTVTRDDGKGTVDVHADGTFTMPASDVTVTAEFTNITYKVSFNANGGSGMQMADMDAVYGTSTPLSANTYTREGYEFVGWAKSENATEADVITHADNLTTVDGATVPLYAVWKKATYSVTLYAKDGTIAEGKDVTEYTFGTGATLPTADEITKTGYTFDGWFTSENFTGEAVTAIGADETGDKTFYAKWTAITYYITYKDGNNVIGEREEYTIESGYKLKGYEKPNYSFTDWTITATTEPSSWEVNKTIDAGTLVNGFYGDVTLTANLTFMAHLVESYKYADSDYVMLRVADDLNDVNQEYKFNGESMYWTGDENYLINDTDDGVFYTLVEAQYIADGKLNAAGEAKLTTGDVVDGARAEIDRDSGDINGDTVVNIADANIVYQMTKYTGSYYADKLSIEQRLMADMDTTYDALVDDHRGAINDVEVIVNMINGVTG